MPSHDMRWTIERYPCYRVGEIMQYSYGCPDLELMGYANISSLLLDMAHRIKELQKKSQRGKKE